MLTIFVNNFGLYCNRTQINHVITHLRPISRFHRRYNAANSRLTKTHRLQRIFRISRQCWQFRLCRNGYRWRRIRFRLARYDRCLSLHCPRHRGRRPWVRSAEIRDFARLDAWFCTVNGAASCTVNGAVDCTVSKFGEYLLECHPPLR